jgi:hypothetical protein
MKPSSTLSRLLQNYQPKPGPAFSKRMTAAPWYSQETMNPSSHHPFKFGAWTAAAMVLLLLILGFSIPPVRAAIGDWLGLSVAPSNQMPADALTLVPLTPAASMAPSAALTTTTAVSPAVLPSAVPTSQPAQPALPTNPPDPTMQSFQATAQPGWTVLYAAHLPEGYHLESVYYDTGHQMVMLTYLVTRPLPGSNDSTLTASHSITLAQALKNDVIPLQIAPDTQPDALQINGQPAAYAIGAWDTQFQADSSDPNGGKMVSTWRNDLAVQNVFWQVGPVYLALITDDDAVQKADLVEMAQSVR